MFTPEKAFNDNMGVTARDKFKLLTAVATGTLTHEMSVHEHVIWCVTNDTEPITVSLPPVSEARGMIYAIYVKARSVDNVTVTDRDDDAGLSDITLDATAEYTLLLSDGFYWYEIASNHA